MKRLVVSVREIAARRKLRHVLNEADELVGMGDGQRAQEDGVEEGEEGCGDAQADAQQGEDEEVRGGVSG